MSKFVCDSGEVSFGSTDFENTTPKMCFTNATIDISCDNVSMRCMGADAADKWTETAATTKTWSCTFETALDDTVGVDLDGTLGVTALLEFDTIITGGRRYHGQAIITSISINAPVDEYATVSWEATGTDALTEAATDG